LWVGGGGGQSSIYMYFASMHACGKLGHFRCSCFVPPQQSTAFVKHNNDGCVLVKYMAQVTTD